MKKIAHIANSRLPKSSLDPVRQVPLWKQYTHAAREVLVESIWPTRCGICDSPGEVLCEKCRRNLPYIDYWNACRHCAAPFGRILCSECNPVSLKSLGERQLPFESCTSATVFNANSGALVSVYKDYGERRLAGVLAEIMAPLVNPLWLEQNRKKGEIALTYIPATQGAFRRRGFDHAELLAEKLGEVLCLPCISLLERPVRKDQRKLGRSGRLHNMEKSLKVLDNAYVPEEILLIDDVYTTGSTLIAASKTLTTSGAKSISCMTFARVF